MRNDRRIILYIASSLDGFIARRDGSVDWLFSDQDYGYQEFFDSIDTVIVGRITYEQSLSFVQTPFGDKACYVFTHRERPAEGKVEFVHGEVKTFVNGLLPRDGKNIWLVGGGQIIDQFLREDLIDEFIISVHPLLLGEGMPLFLNSHPQVWLKISGCTHFSSGLVQLHYVRERT